MCQHGRKLIHSKKQVSGVSLPLEQLCFFHVHDSGSQNLIYDL